MAGDPQSGQAAGLFVDHDAPRAMYDSSCLNAQHIEDKVLSVMGVQSLAARRTDRA